MADDTKILTKYWDDPDLHHIESYISHGGYEGLRKALFDMSPQEIIDEVIKANLRGRGGAGFPAGRKWSFIPKDPSLEKYVLCNADEGEPGTFNNRELMERNPHQLIEGCLIAAYAIGATRAFILIRGEYRLPANVLEDAIAEAYAKGIAGSNAMGSGKELHILLQRGAGSYEVGEETALIECMEGSRGNPRTRPPFPAIKGLYQKPTVVNNVETLCNAPHILLNGAEWFAGIGAPSCPGTKFFSLSGNVAKPGNYEMPMGTTFRQLLEIGGGVPNGRKVQAIMLGAAPPMLNGDQLDVNADIDSVQKVGSQLGSGSVIYIDDSWCMIDVTLRAASFFHHESCGKCTPCREGTGWMHKIVDRIANGLGRREDIDLLLDICDNIAGKSLCALGEFSTGPILSSIKHFRDHYEEHIRTGTCQLRRSSFERHAGAAQPVLVAS
ncbi:MAG TPA: NADH-quinone oxidoreductase subunit NuoF [Chloroflexota bacterium]|nr:NADH-quinone oxidoreductase subunit NuoF [Chloroflexota bacterium]